MKFRLIKRARGWVVQELLPEIVDNKNAYPSTWVTVACWRFRIFAKFHLTLLREMNRK